MQQPVSFLTGPTPVERAPGLAAAMGLGPEDLLVKRDDLIGLGGDGNKVRKLEITCAQALAEGARTTVAGLLTAMGCTAAPEALRIDDAQIGRGHEHLSEHTRAAVELAARTEGLAVDATYVGRAVAGLVAAAAAGSIGPGETTVLLHTGGLPGLFGHPELG